MANADDQLKTDLISLMRACVAALEEIGLDVLTEEQRKVHAEHKRQLALLEVAAKDKP